MKEDLEDLKKFVKQFVINEFKPFIEYNENLDMLYVQLKDCSYFEQWQSRSVIYPLFELHTKESRCIGFVIMCASYVLDETFPIPNINKKYYVNEILNAIHDTYSDASANIINFILDNVDNDILSNLYIKILSTGLNNLKIEYK